MEYRLKVNNDITTNNQMNLSGDVKLGFKGVSGGILMPSASTKDYNKLDNKPRVNNIELIGNKTSTELKLQDEMDTISNQDIDKIIFGG